MFEAQTFMCFPYMFLSYLDCPIHLFENYSLETPGDFFNQFKNQSQNTQSETSFDPLRGLQSSQFYIWLYYWIVEPSTGAPDEPVVVCLMATSDSTFKDIFF